MHTRSPAIKIYPDSYLHKSSIESITYVGLTAMCAALLWLQVTSAVSMPALWPHSMSNRASPTNRVFSGAASKKFQRLEGRFGVGLVIVGFIRGNDNAEVVIDAGFAQEAGKRGDFA